jgi:hypothetical protein
VSAFAPAPPPSGVTDDVMPAAGPERSTRCSVTDPQAPHPGQRPAHCASCWPHPEHVKMDRVFATDRTLAPDTDRLTPT